MVYPIRRVLTPIPYSSAVSRQEIGGEPTSQPGGGSPGAAAGTVAACRYALSDCQIGSLADERAILQLCDHERGDVGPRDRRPSRRQPVQRHPILSRRWLVGEERRAHDGVIQIAGLDLALLRRLIARDVPQQCAHEELHDDASHQGLIGRGVAQRPRRAEDDQAPHLVALHCGDDIGAALPQQIALAEGASAQRREDRLPTRDRRADGGGVAGIALDHVDSVDRRRRLRIAHEAGDDVTAIPRLPDELDAGGAAGAEDDDVHAAVAGIGMTIVLLNAAPPTPAPPFPPAP
jgi:hypothetical protein